MATRNRIEIRSITPSVGAVVEGVDLREALGKADAERIREAVLRHGVLFFRDQDITREQTAAFMRIFGELTIDPYAKAYGMDGLPIEALVHDMPTFGNRNATAIWHIDSTLGECPASYLSLRALKLPPTGGGDTCWGSMYAAYDALSEPVKDMVDGLYAEHSGAKTLPLLDPNDRGVLDEPMRNVHPVVRVHPETGKKALFVNELWTDRIVGVSQHESDSILRMLYTHSQRAEFTMRWQWRENDLAFWDNRAFQHYAVRDYEGERVLQKAYVRGDKPVGPRPPQG